MLECRPLCPRFIAARNRFLDPRWNAMSFSIGHLLLLWKECNIGDPSVIEEKGRRNRCWVATFRPGTSSQGRGKPVLGIIFFYYKNESRWRCALVNDKLYIDNKNAEYLLTFITRVKVYSLSL
ncbi:hypothetical protein AVEN_187090-1 [Araneus ventricosus]|uniref:Uncharacterized protein n=1 Tax=Araneus ventricosus TaxID=182803 RepID=A0A4Y2LMR9_ARAVE|nr:hypothetical protein AVEN_187090-1 [Araneus ventricosus]